MTNKPIVEGPITGPGDPFYATGPSDEAMAATGYEGKEYFISGTATSYREINLPANGFWEVEPAGSTAYKTRLMVYRPVDKAKFNGTVVVEWLNVTGGIDAAPIWIYTHNELLRRGYAWIGVSAQYGGVAGKSAISTLDSDAPSYCLKDMFPERYESLIHPGDAYSYDIFSQVAKAIRSPGSVNLLAGYNVKRILAVGESQSAMYLTAYVNAIQPREKLYDGFLLQGRFGMAIFDSDQPSVDSEDAQSKMSKVDFSNIKPVLIRTDVNVPVMMLQSETDVIMLGYYKARQADTDKIRLWEMAGTAHADLYMAVTGQNDYGKNPSVANVEEVTNLSPLPDSVLPINSGPQHFIAKAAIHQLDRWVRTSVPPPVAARLESQGDPAEYVLDENGNVKGGVRTPYVDVPVAKLSGLGQPRVTLAHTLFGITKLFDKAKLSKLYPDHRTYVKAVEKATDSAVQAGFLLAEDGELIKKAAEASDIGNP